MTTTPDAETVATTQPALPTFELPEYHGRKPVGMKTAVNGAGTRITRAHGIDDRVVLVIEGKVRKAGHESTDDGLVYVETIKVADLFELDTDQGSRLLSALRSTHRLSADTAAGRSTLPTMGEVGYTDASGVVLTPAEVAALRGDPIRVLVTDQLTPAVIVLDDGTRMLWPEDFDTNEPRPFVGENIGTETEPLEVLEVLHTVTGEPLGAPAAPPLEQDREATEAEDARDRQLAELGIVADPEALDQYDDPAPALVVGYDETTDETSTRFVSAERRAADKWDTAAAKWETGGIIDPPAPASAEHEPAGPDFATVDVSLNKLTERLVTIDDPDQLRRLLAAEQRGRGRGLKPRKGALDAIENRIAARLSADAAAAATVANVEEW